MGFEPTNQLLSPDDSIDLHSPFPSEAAYLKGILDRNWTEKRWTSQKRIFLVFAPEDKRKKCGAPNGAVRAPSKVERNTWPKAGKPADERRGHPTS